MKWSILPALLAGATLFAADTAAWFNDLSSEKAKNEYWWICPGSDRITTPGLGTEVINKDGKEGFRGIMRGIQNPQRFGGKRIRCSVEAKGQNLVPMRDAKTAGKFMLTIQAGKRFHYPQSNPLRGTYDWTKYTFEYDVPADVNKMDFALGFESGKGKIWFRNLKMEVLDTYLDLTKAVNMGYADRIQGDGKGGWSDQGSDNDAKRFDFKQERYANVPFHPIDPAKNNGKSVVTFKSRQFVNGAASVPLDLSRINASGKYLYIMHTSAHGANGIVGTIEVTGVNGAKQKFEVLGGRDLNDWWFAKPGPNAHPAFVWTNSSGGIVGVFASCFAIDPKIGRIKEIRFNSNNTMSVWILVAATLSDNKYEFPKSEIMKITENAVWKKFPFPDMMGVIPGSALDNGFEKPVPCGTYGRVIINKDGDYVFEKRPNERVHFYAGMFPNEYVRTKSNQWYKNYKGKKLYTDFIYSGKDDETKTKIHDMLQYLRHKGYNMLRMHMIDGWLCETNGLDIPAEVMDNFHYAIYQMKQNGMYLNMDIGASHLGFYPGTTWANWTWRKDHKDAKIHVYFDKDSKENWVAGAKKLLLTMNPYTKTRLVDDPVLVNIIGFNEQEFVFSRDSEFPQAHPRWIEFLKVKYGSIDKLKAAWKSKENWKDFKDLPVFVPSIKDAADQRGRDAYEYTRTMEAEVFDFYRTELRKLGWKGPITNFNMGKSLNYVLLREKAEYVAMNSYFAHPIGYVQPGATINQGSSIGCEAGIAREFYAYQMIGKPMVITEHGHVFWNRYRYEQAFVTDGFGALQGVQGITVFIGQDQVVNRKIAIHPFGGTFDPIMYAAEFLAYHIYGRGDVRRADLRTRIVLDKNEIKKNHAYNWGIGGEQTRMVLLGRFGLEVTNDGKPHFPVSKNEVVLKRTGGSAVVVKSTGGGAGYTTIVDSGKALFDVDEMVVKLKKQGLLPKNNRTNAAKGIFESSTGELYLDSGKKFMSINTKKLQGICALAGTSFKLPEFEVVSMNRDGNLAVVAVGKAKDIKSAKRLVVVYATDALNTDQVFNDSTRRVMQRLGKFPILLETGTFTVRVKNSNAKSLKAWALGINGKRQCQIPVKARNGYLELTVDTSKLAGGPAVFFELAEK